jgi:hypothetical protein
MKNPLSCDAIEGYKLLSSQLYSTLLYFLVPCLLISFLQLNNDVHAAQVHLQWEPSYSYVDGYTVHWGTSSGNYSHAYDVGLATNYYVSGLSEHTTYYFAVTAYAGDYRSDYSIEASSRGSIPISGGNDVGGDSRSSAGCTMSLNAFDLESLFLYFFIIFIFYIRKFRQIYCKKRDY